MHDSNSGAARISCGTLAAQRVADDGQLSMAESLYGLVPREGLITVHSGSSCESADSIGQPLLTGDEDVWRNKKYLTNNAGQSRGSFPVAIGYGSSNLEGRVAVVSDSVGNRIACTQLQANSWHHQIFWAGRRHGGLAFAQIGLLVPLVCLILLSLLQVLQMLGIGPLASWSTASLSITVTAFESLLSGVWIPVFSMALGVALFISAESHVRAVGAVGAILAFLALAVSAAIDRLLLYSLRRK